MPGLAIVTCSRMVSTMKMGSNRSTVQSFVLKFVWIYLKSTNPQQYYYNMSWYINAGVNLPPWFKMAWDSLNKEKKTLRNENAVLKYINIRWLRTTKEEHCKFYFNIFVLPQTLKCTDWKIKSDFFLCFCVVIYFSLPVHG